ncbi:MAG: phenylalanine--tRNA ligase subunit beta [Deltaproteobacteria bacterium]|nr:phenylalanine--tRNA ligase subunit beta [Deltaproteobacteria bacterium]
MRISLNWLGDFLDIDISPGEIARRLTLAGIEAYAEAFGIMACEVVEVGDHPHADKLKVCRVFDGTGYRQVVCGAPNTRKGMKTALVTPGAILPGGIEVKTAKVRGVVSEGMLCSEKELGLSDEHSGIIEFDASFVPGGSVHRSLKDYADVVIELDLTPNRPDCLSHLGAARELGAILGRHIKPVSTGLDKVLDGAPVSGLAEIEVKAPDKCPRYCARIIEGVKIGECPGWVRARLEAAGIRSINNVVDATNYVLLELGQPLHAFDLDRLAGAKIIVRPADPGESFTTLDGITRKLSRDDLVIADADRPVALAGIMGGLDSEVTKETTRILLESAWFEPRSIRRTSKRYDLNTESSRRFSAGVDPEGIDRAADRCAALISDWAGGRVARGRIDVYPKPFKPIETDLRMDRLARILGKDIEAGEAAAVLEGLDFSVTESDTNTLHVRIPGFRPDVEREIDLIEEVARLYGYNKIPATRPVGYLKHPEIAKELIFERKTRQALVAAGASQAYNYAFVAPDFPERLQAPADHPVADLVQAANPIKVEFSALRTTLLPGLLYNVQTNVNQRAESVFLFEIGTVFKNTPRNDENLPVERRVVGGVLWGSAREEKWFGRSRDMDFYDAKGAVETILGGLKVDLGIVTWKKANQPWLNPHAAASLMMDHSVAGWVGEILPSVCSEFDVPWPVFAFELDIGIIGLAGKETIEYKSLPKFPSIRRDVALIVDEDLDAASIIEAAEGSGAGFVAHLDVFDVYKGETIPPGKKSIAIKIVYRSNEGSLESSRIDEENKVLVQALRDKLNAEIRDS